MWAPPGGRTLLPKFRFSAKFPIGYFTHDFINADKKIRKWLLYYVKNYFNWKSIEVQRWTPLEVILNEFINHTALYAMVAYVAIAILNWALGLLWAPQAKRMHQIVRIDFENYNFSLCFWGDTSPFRHPLSLLAQKFCQSLILAPPLKKSWIRPWTCLYIFASIFHAESKYGNENMNLKIFTKNERINIWCVVWTRYRRRKGYRLQL